MHLVYKSRNKFLLNKHFEKYMLNFVTIFQKILKILNKMPIYKLQGFCNLTFCSNYIYPHVTQFVLCYFFCNILDTMTFVIRLI